MCLLHELGRESVEEREMWDEDEEEVELEDEVVSMVDESSSRRSNKIIQITNDTTWSSKLSRSSPSSPMTARAWLFLTLGAIGYWPLCWLAMAVSCLSNLSQISPNIKFMCSNCCWMALIMIGREKNQESKWSACWWIRTEHQKSQSNSRMTFSPNSIINSCQINRVTCLQSIWPWFIPRSSQCH